MSNFLLDNFTDADNTLVTAHTPDVGGAWSNVAASSGTTSPARIASNTAYGTGTGNTGYSVMLNAATPNGSTPANYIVGARFKCLSDPSSLAGGKYTGVYGRATAANNGYQAVIGEGNQLCLYRNSSSKMGPSSSSFTATVGESYDVYLDISGSTIAARMQRLSDSLWLKNDGTFQSAQVNAISTTDSTITAAGSAGLWLANDTGATTGWHCDAVVAYGDGTGGFAAPTPATAVTISGPAAGTVGAASTAFTVGANGVITGTVVVTPNDSSGGGTFSPGSINLTSASPTGTFTYTPGSTGSKSVAVTNNGSLTNPSAITYVASSAGGSVVTFPVTNANIFFSPYNWYSDGSGSMQANNARGASTYAWSNNRGAYIRFKATVGDAGTIRLNVNTASLASVNAAGCPNLAWSVAGGATQTKLLASGDTQVTLATGLSAGTYEVFVAFRSVYITQDGGTAACYFTPNNRVQVTGIELSTGGTLSAPTLKSKRMVIWGDSITEGDINVSNSRSGSSQDANQTYGWFLAEALDAEVGIIGWYGQNFDFFVNSWSNYASGVSRLIGGALLPAPDYAVCNYGENDGDPGPASSAATNVLAAISAAAPTAKIVLNIPFSGKARTNLAAATLPSNGYRTDLARYEFLPGCTQWSFDGQHPTVQGHANLGSLLAAKVLAATGGVSTPAVPPSFVINLGGVGLTNLGQLVPVV